MQILETMDENYKIGQVVLVAGQKFKYGLIPATIIQQSGFKAYQIRIYGDKIDTFISEYNIKKFKEETYLEILHRVQKSNKKMIKLLKKAEKDHKQFLSNPQNYAKQKQLQRLYLKQEQMDQNVGEQFFQVKLYESRAEAIRKTKVRNILQQNVLNDGKILLKYNDVWGRCTETEQTVKTILILKLKFVFDELLWQVDTEKNKIICQQIMTSNIIEPIQYIVSPLLYKINEYLQIHYKKNTKNYFLKFLFSQRDLFLKSLQNYLVNYSVFKEARDQFINVLSS